VGGIDFVREEESSLIVASALVIGRVFLSSGLDVDILSSIRSCWVLFRPFALGDLLAS
jgi:hypothetical protein